MWVRKAQSRSLNQAPPSPTPLTNTHSLTHSLQAHESLESILSSEPVQSPSPADLTGRAGKRFSPPAPALGFPGNSVGKESACNAGDPSSIPGSGRSPGEWLGYPLQYSWACLLAQLVKNPPACGRPGFDPWFRKSPWIRERLPTPVFWPGEFGVAKSRTWLTFTSLSFCPSTGCFYKGLNLLNLIRWPDNYHYFQGRLSICILKRSPWLLCRKWIGGGWGWTQGTVRSLSQLPRWAD